MSYLYKIFLVTLISLFGLNIIASAQCSAVRPTYPDTVDKGQPFTLKNTRPNFSYDLDFSTGDGLNQQLSATAPGGAPYNNINSYTINEDADRYYGIWTNSSVGVIRTDLGANPGVSPLGGGGVIIGIGTLPNAFECRVIKESGGGYTGLITNANGKLAKVVFGSTIGNAPAVSIIPNITLNNPAGLQLFLDSGKTWAVVANSGANAISLLGFGANMANNMQPTLRNIGIPGGSNIAAVSVIKECNQWVALAVSKGNNSIYRVNLGSSLSAPDSVITQVYNFGNVAINTVSLFTADANYCALVGANNGNFYRLNFGGSVALNNGPDNLQVGTGILPNCSGTNLALTRFSQLTAIGFNKVTQDARILTFPSISNIDTTVFIGAKADKSFTFNRAGKYRIQTIVTDSTGSRSVYLDSMIVSNTQAVNLTFSPDKQCTGDSITFKATVIGQVSTLLWSFGDGSPVATGLIVKHKYLTSGDYKVTVRGIRSGKEKANVSNTYRIYDGSRPRPNSNFTAPANICTNTPLTLVDISTLPGGAVRKRFWDFGNGQTSTAFSPTITYTTAGTYTITLTASDSSGCGNPFSRQIVVNPKTPLDFSVIKVCLGDSTEITINPSAGFTSFNIDFGNGIFKTTGATQIRFYYATSAAYPITITGVNSFGCTSTASKTIVIYNKPKPSISIPFYVFVADTTTFTNTSFLPNGQSLGSVRYKFFDGSADSISTSINARHAFPTLGTFNINVRITTNIGCIADTTYSITTTVRCPSVATGLPAAVADLNQNIQLINNAGPGIVKYQYDFCGGDLANRPLLKLSSLGYTDINTFTMVSDSNKFYGFLNVSPSASSGSNTLFRLDFNKDPGGKFNITPLGNTQNLNNAVASSYIKEGNNWYGLLLNYNGANLVRINFGNAISNYPQSVTPIPGGPNVGNGYGFDLVKDRDSLFAFVTNSQSGNTNNLIRLSFGNSVTNTPQNFTFNNTGAMSTSTGLVGIKIVRECAEWFGFATSTTGQIIRLKFGFTLSNNSPTFSSVTSEITGAAVPLPLQLFSNAGHIEIENDGGVFYGFVTNRATGNIIRLKFGNGLANPPTEAINLGNLGGLTNQTRAQIFRNGSDTYLFTLDANSRSLATIKFPDACRTSGPTWVETTSNVAPNNSYTTCGNFLISTKGTNNVGWSNYDKDSISINCLPLQASISCPTGSIQNSGAVCAGSNLSITTTANAAVAVDNSAGEFAKSPLAPVSQGINFPYYTIAFNTIKSGANYYGIIAGRDNNVSVISRLSYGSTLNNAPLPATKEIYRTGDIVTDAILVKSGTDYFSIIAFNNNYLNIGEFGNSVGNEPGSTTNLFLPNVIFNAKGLEWIKENGNNYLVVTNNNPAGITVLNFGNSFRNVPTYHIYNLSGAQGATRLSLAKQCGLVAGVLTDNVGSNLFHVSFPKGLDGAPLFQKFPAIYNTIPQPYAVKIIKDAGLYFGFVTSVVNNNVYRVPLGQSITDTLYGSINTFPSFATGLVGIGISAVKTEDGFSFVQAIANATNPAPYRYYFNNAGAPMPPTSNATGAQQVVYGASGNYIAEAIVTDSNGNTSSYTTNVSITAPLQGNFITIGSKCAGQPIQFQNTTSSGGNFTSYGWNFGDTTNSTIITSTDITPIHTYKLPGVYNVTLYITAGGCQSTVVRQIKAFAKPVPAFSFPPSNCTNDSIPFTDNSTGAGDTLVSWQWRAYNLNNPSVIVATSIAQNAKFKFQSLGNYLVTLQVRGKSGCDSTSAPQPVSVLKNGTNVKFGIKFGTNCLSDTVQFIDSIPPIPGSTRLWSFGNAGVTSQDPPFAIYTSTGLQTVTLTLTNAQGCVTSLSKTFNINARPFGIINAQIACVNNPTAFSITQGSDLGKYLWNFGGGVNDTSSSSSPLKTFTTIGLKNITCRITSLSGCSRLLASSVLVQNAPTALFSYNGKCAGTPFNFTSTSTANGIAGGITSYFWDFGDGKPGSSSANPSYIFESGGTYNVRLTVKAANGCPSTQISQVSVASQPKATVKAMEGCIGTPYTFVDVSTLGGFPSIGGASQWVINGTTYNTGTVVALFSAANNPYVVSLTHTSAEGCTNTATYTYNVQSSTKATFSINQTIFTTAPFKVTFTNTSTGNRFRWLFGDGSAVDTTPAPTHTYTATGTYKVTLIASQGNACYDTAYNAVSVVSDIKRDIAVRNVTVNSNNGLNAITADIENVGNVGLSNLKLLARVNQQTSVQEIFNGTLLPGDKAKYTFKANFRTDISQLLDVVCVTAELAADAGLNADLYPDLTPENNTSCATGSGRFALLTLVPNPVSDVATVQYAIPDDGGVEVRIVDMTGRVVSTLENGTMLAGVHQNSFDATTLTAAVYYLEVRFKDDVRRLKFVKQ